MIIGDKRELVINNIKEATEKQEYNLKVEINDPRMSQEEKKKIINNYLVNKEKISYKAKNELARVTVDFFTWLENRESEIIGIENVKNIETGAIITNNHFNPLDSTIIRKFVRKLGKRKLFIVGEDTNLAMEGIIGFIMNYADVIPISNNIGYMKRDFPQILSKKLEEKNFILIYPEQEMWFNYRKPRPPKPGAYYYAAKNNVPIISCFTEIIDIDKQDNDEFNKVKYVLHILEPIYPDNKKTIKENTQRMKEIDFEQKKNAYEKAYNKKLDYKFEKEDIAGLI